ncbi:structure-specific endonuclease subunit EME1 [Pelodytes ibericus]
MDKGRINHIKATPEDSHINGAGLQGGRKSAALEHDLLIPLRLSPLLSQLHQEEKTNCRHLKKSLALSVSLCGSHSYLHDVNRMRRWKATPSIVLVMVVDVPDCRNIVHTKQNSSENFCRNFKLSNDKFQTVDLKALKCCSPHDSSSFTSEQSDQRKNPGVAIGFGNVGVLVILPWRLGDAEKLHVLRRYEVGLVPIYEEAMRGDIATYAGLGTGATDSPGLLQGGQGRQVLSALQVHHTTCVIQTQPVVRSITWKRMPGHVEGEDPCQEDFEMVILVPAEEFVAMVQNQRKVPQSDYSNETLRRFVTISKACIMPTMVILEMEKYFRGHKDKTRKRLKVNQEEPCLTRVQVEEAVIDIQLHMGLHIWFLETWDEFADFACMFSKAVAEAPAKKQRNNSLSFYLDGDWAGGVRVERGGKGLLGVWMRQIQQFNRVSMEIANAVVVAYSSPQILIKAYNSCATETERYNMLSDIIVRRGEGITSTHRRVGLDISKRIYVQFTSLDPELLLDLS